MVRVNGLHAFRAVMMSALLALVMAFGAAAPASARPQFSAISVDARNGKVLFAADPDGLRHPASLTKVMTLYLLFQDLKAGKVNLKTKLKVSARAASMAPSKLGVKSGSTITVDEAIRALVTKSANDVAATIGENLGGSESAFAVRMTKTAHAIGMSRSTFKNASGLPNPAQVTTARDMATLSLRIQRDFPQYYPYFRIMAFTYKGKTIRTHNRLLGHYDGADGIKTGYIGASGYNLTSSAKRGGKRVVGVVMGARSSGARNAYMMAMLDRAFPKCTNGKTIAAVAGSSKGAVDPIGNTETAETSQPNSKKPHSILAALTGKKAAAPEQPSTEGDLAAAAAQAADDGGDNNADEDTAENAPDPQGNTFKTVTATAPDEPKVLEAHLGTPPAGKKLPFAVKAPAAQADVDQTATISDEGWKVQVGNYKNKQDALAVMMTLKKKQPALLKDKMAFTVTIEDGGKTSYRGRFTGFTEGDAKTFCGKLARQKLSCETLSPQS